MFFKTHFNLVFFFLVIFTTCSFGQNNTCLPNGVVYECKCIWTKQNDNGEGIEASLTACQKHGGRLATFTNMSQIRGMAKLTGVGTDTFIGAVRVPVNGSVGYVWKDTNIETFFSRWTNITDVHEQNKTCLALMGDKLQAVSCSSWIRYLCERDLSVPVSTTPGTSTSSWAKCDGITIAPPFVKNTPTLTHTSSMTGVYSSSTTDITTPSTTPVVTIASTGGVTTIPLKVNLLELGAHVETEVVLAAINKAHISNMSDVEVKVMVKEFSEVVASANDSNQSDVRKMTLAMVKLSSMKTCDDKTFDMYASTVSAVVAMIPSDLEPGSEGEGDRGGQPGDILDAMERVMLATSITAVTEIYESFSIQIQSYNGSEDMVIESNSSDRIQLASTVFSSGEGRVFTVIYKSFHKKISKRSKKFNKVELCSKVISVAVQDIADTHKTQINTPNAINFTVSHVLKQNSKQKSRICVFWNEKDNEWSDTGCHLLHSNTSHTTCTCNHLTSFAVLVLYYDNDELSDMNERVLYILSAVGCSLSILGLAMTLFSYIYLRMLHRERILIHANLAASLMLAQIVFVASGDAHSNKILCKIVAVLMHFFFMAAFTWMMLEGLCLYLSCLRAQYNFGDMRIKYTVIGWGVPVLVVILSTAIQFPNYGNGPGDSCWLSVEHGLIWAFMAPMFLIVTFNLIILGLVIKVFLTLKANSHKTEAARIRAGLRAMSMLLPLLGVTWLLSVLVPYSTIFHYLFVIGNSLQGLMIFFLHCLCNEEVRKFLAAKRSPLSTGTTSSDIDLSGFRRRHRSEAANSFDDVRPGPSSHTENGREESKGRRHAWT